MSYVVGNASFMDWKLIINTKLIDIHVDWCKHDSINLYGIVFIKNDFSKNRDEERGQELQNKLE